jgi:Fe2+ transport system protein FeoA
MTEFADRARIRFPLPRLRSGHCAIVRDVRSGHDDIHRLQAMGICRGREVLLVRSGDPLIVRVLGSRIGVSARLAAHVEVEARVADAVPTEEP